MREKRYSLDLGRHLSVCDGNYLRLTKLMPCLGRHAKDAGSVGERRTFRVVVGAAAPTVTIEVLECGPYTTLLRLSQGPTDGTTANGRLTAMLGLKVRLYHDARSAEVVEFQGERRFESAYVYPNREMRQPDEKAQLNRFLADFLNACLRHGVAMEGVNGLRLAAGHAKPRSEAGSEAFWTEVVEDGDAPVAARPQATVDF